MTKSRMGCQNPGEVPAQAGVQCQPACHCSQTPVSLASGLLSRVVPLRRKLADAGDGAPLKLLIMSATLRLEDFADNRRRASAHPQAHRSSAADSASAELHQPFSQLLAIGAFADVVC